MTLFTPAVSNSRPDNNRRQSQGTWQTLVAVALCAAILLPVPAPATPLVESTPDATVADGIIAIREGNFREAVTIWTPHTGAPGTVPSALQGRGAQGTCRFHL